MKDYEFRVRIYPDRMTSEILGSDSWFDSVSEAVFAEFMGDVTPSFVSDTIILDCLVESRTLESAIRRVTDVLRAVLGEPMPGSYPYGSPRGPLVEIDLPASQFSLA